MRGLLFHGKPSRKSSRHRRFHVVRPWFWMHFVAQMCYFALFCPVSSYFKMYGPVIVIPSYHYLGFRVSFEYQPQKKLYRSLNLCHFVVTEGSPRICQVPSFCRGKLELCSVIAVHPGVVATKMVHNSTRET